MIEPSVSFAARSVPSPQVSVPSPQVADADQIRAFYDDHIVQKVADFVDGNPRVEAAWQTIQQWAPVAPRQVLDVGCGFGQMSWQMATRWPAARVTGVDISPRSIALASQVFSRPNLQYTTATLDTLDAAHGYDLITLIDVYEHVADDERAGFDSLLARVLAPDGVMVLTFPTPAYQRQLRDREPAKLQPIDEDITPATIDGLAAATGTRLVLYREQNIWRSGDYAHAVLTRAATSGRVERPAARHSRLLDRVARTLRLLGRSGEDGSRASRLRQIERTLGAGVYRPR